MRTPLRQTNTNIPSPHSSPKGRGSSLSLWERACLSGRQARERAFLTILFFALCSLLIAPCHAVTGWTTDPVNCDSSYMTIDCPEGQKICAYDGSKLKCAVPADVNAALPATNGTADNKLTSGTGGYQVNCTKNASICTPYSGLWECKASTTCATKNLKTVCTASAHTSTCGTCLTGYLDCNGAGTGVDADGCEIQVGGSCTLGSLSGTYDTACQGSNPPTCITPVADFQTGTLAEQSSSNPLLWGKQYGSGYLMNLSNSYNDTVVIDAGGKMGIGKTSASYKLDVDSGATNVVARFASGDPTATLLLKDDTGTSYINSTAGVTSLGSVAGTDATNLNILADGKVGIGTTAPTTKLYLYESSTNVIETIESDSGYTQLKLDGVITTDAQVGVLTFLNAGDTIGQIDLLRDGANDAGTMRFFTQATGGANAERMRISSTGNIGIGKTAPATALDVAGTVTATAFSGDGAAITNLDLSSYDTDEIAEGTTHLYFTDERATTAVGGAVNDSGSGASDLWSASKISQVITSSADTDWVESGENIYRSNGNVGIGTTSPSTKVHLYSTNSNVELRMSADGIYDPIFRMTGENDGTSEGLALWYDNSAGNVYFDHVHNSAASGIYFRNKSAGTPINTMVLIDGNVGIGTTSPGTKLDVAGATSIDTQLRIDGSAPETYFVDSDGTDWKIQSQDNHLLFLGGSDLTEKMRLQSNGLLGIGTTSPLGKLHVAGSTAGPMTALVLENTYDGNNTVDLLFKNTSGGTVYTSGIRGSYSDGNMIFTAPRDLTTGGFKFNNNAGETKLFVSAGNGNVGIGTTSPNNLLSVTRNSALTSPMVRIGEDGTGDSNLLFANTATGFLMGMDNSDLDKFKIANSGTDLATNTLFAMTTGGYVGIGTTSPASKLNVFDGDIRISSTTGNYGFITTRAGTMYGAFSSANFRPTIEIRGGAGFDIANSSGSSVAFFKDNGNVGIGTTSPTAQLHTQGALSTALTGTVTVTAAATAVTGTGTAFTTELAVGDAIKIGSEVFTVSAITDATHLTLDSAHTAGATGATAYSDPDLFALDNGDGANKFIVQSDGKVGVGTTSLTDMFTVAGNGSDITTAIETYSSSNADISEFEFRKSMSDTLGTKTTTTISAYLGSLMFKGVDTGNNFDYGAYLLAVQEGAAGVYIPTRLDFTTYSSTASNGPVLSLNSSGNVGIGTTSPTYKLDVNAGASQAAARYTSSGVGSFNDFTSATGTGRIGFFSQNVLGLAYGSGTTPHLSVNSSGNVGVGTTSPVQKLVISGADDIYTEIAATGVNSDSGIKITNDETNWYARIRGANGNVFELSDGTTSPLQIEPTAPNNLLWLDSLGRVGIKTNAPTTALDVAGTVTATAFVGDGSGLTGISSALSDLSDTTITAAASGDFLRHNGTAWVDATIGASDIPDISATYQTVAGTSAWDKNASDDFDGSLLENIGDVTITAAASGDILQYNGTAWVDSPLASGDIPDLSAIYQPIDADLTDLADGSLTATKVQYGSNFITTAGTSGQVWKSDGAGAGVWGTDDTGTDDQTCAEVSGCVVGAITSYTETDTLASVTGRGATTTAAITTGGLTVDTNTLYVDATNNRVGIGTTSPTASLAVNGNIVFPQGAGVVASFFKNAYYSGGWKSLGAGYSTQMSFGDGSGNIRFYNTSTAATGANEAITLVERLSILPDGNVGIGTTSPSKKLDVNGDVQSTGNIISNTFRPIGTTLTLGIVSEIISIPGNVGIGTTTPDAELNVVTSNGAANINLDSFDDGAGMSVLSLRKSHVDTVGTKTTTLTGDILGQIQFQGVDSGSAFDTGAYIRAVQNGTAGVKVPTDLILESSTGAGTNSNQLVLATNGNVGIGTTSPSQKLHINGGTSAIRLRIDTTNEDPSMLLTTVGQQDWSIGVDYSDSGKLKFDTSSVVGASTKMTILSTGNVGIGTTAPTRKLTIVGSSSSTNNQLLSFKQYSNDFGYSFNIDDVTTGRMYIQGIGTAGAETNIMTLDRVTANVGIGTATPAATLDVNGTMRVTQICDENGAHCKDVSANDWSEDSGIFVGVSAVSTGDAAHDTLVGYQAANDLCDTAVAGSHVCSVEEMTKTIFTTTDLTTLSGWTAGGTTQVWVTSGGAKYAPAAIPANDCIGWTDASLNAFGNFWRLNATGGGRGGVGYCNTSKAFACCK